MFRLLHSCVLASLLVALAGCTGESVRVVLPDQHPANPSAQEAPFVPPPDPFAGVTPPVLPSPPEEHPEHRYEHHPGGMDDDMRMDDMRMDDMRMDDMRMDDMRMDDEMSDEMMHGGHGGTGDGERKEPE